MSRTLFVVPAPGRRVWIPGSGELLTEAGANVEATPFWLRRLRDGDVTETRPARTDRAAAKPAKKE